MRSFIAGAIALLFATAARADNYALVNPTGGIGGVPCTTSMIVYDGSSAYTPPSGLTLAPQASAPAQCPPPGPPTTISALSFLMRFTSAERIAIRTSTDPGVQDWLFLLQAQITNGGTIDLTNAEVQAGVNYLTAPATGSALLTSAQASNILSPNFTTPQ